MSEEQRNQQSNSAESTVYAASKTGKAVANVTKGAATGGVHGAALDTAKNAKKWLIPVAAVLLLPVLIVAMLPSVIFGPFFGIGTDNTNAIADDTVLTQNMMDLNTGISTVLSEGLVDVLSRIDTNFAASGCDSMEVNNPYGSDVVFNANSFISMYCASKDQDISSISLSDMESIVLTRDINTAKKWLHDKVRGTERTGVLVSKESARFKPLSMHILPPGDENAVHWFLEDKTDTRSSNYLEDAATEIQVQGLELDYTCLLWDADMRYEDGKWNFYRFNGQTKWIEQSGSSESKQELRKYMLNAYRVLLTRARLGMVICVPVGNPNKTVSGFWEDSTRLPEYYDGTYLYLKSLGIQEI